MGQAPATPLHMRRIQFDPISDLARLRAEAPASRTEASMGGVSFPAWLITRYEDVREVLSDAARFSNSGSSVRAYVAAAAGSEAAAGLPLGQNVPLIGYDPPQHTRLRRMLAPMFTVQRMLRLLPRIEAIVTEHLDDMAKHGGPIDLVQAFALPVPSLVICELLGVPYADRADFQHQSKVVADVTIDAEAQGAALVGLRSHIAELVRHHRAEPGDSLLGALIRDHGDELSDEVLVGIGTLLLFAGHETTANMLSLGALVLLRHPEQLTLLRGDRGLVERAVEELMRYLSIVHSGVIRTATQDVTIGGRAIRAGDAVVCSLSSANRDQNFTGEPDTLDITREPTSHVAFGHGVHHCLGAPLARMEMRVAYPALLHRFPGLRLAVPFEEVAFGESSIFGLKSLPVDW
jgi:cytochrome P450